MNLVQSCEFSIHYFVVTLMTLAILTEFAICGLALYVASCLFEVSTDETGPLTILGNRFLQSNEPIVKEDNQHQTRL